MKHIPAFPIAVPNDFDSCNEGMTLLDYFAAKALQSLIANEKILTNNPIEQLADQAYGIAKAMLKEREKYYENI